MSYNLQELQLKRRNLENYIKKQIPGFQIREKKSSTLMRFLSVLLFFIPRFMTHIKTVIYPVLYVPSIPLDLHPDKKINEIRIISLLAHEYNHLKLRKKFGFMFNILYLLPQLLALFSLLAIMGVWYEGFLWALLFLVFLLPLPAFGRAYIEFKGYLMTATIDYWLRGSKLNEIKANQYAEIISSKTYYFAGVFIKKLIKKKFMKAFERIKSSLLEEDEQEIKKLL